MNTGPVLCNICGGGAAYQYDVDTVLVGYVHIHYAVRVMLYFFDYVEKT